MGRLEITSEHDKDIAVGGEPDFVVLCVRIR